MMTNLWVVVNIILAAMCLYQAGKFSAVIEYDREVYKEKTPVYFHVLYWFDIFFGLYFIIAVYGMGIDRGLQ